MPVPAGREIPRPAAPAGPGPRARGGRRAWTPAAWYRGPMCCSPTRGWPRRSSGWAGRRASRPGPGPRKRPGPAGSRRARWAAPRVAGLPARPTTLTPVINATGVLLHTNLGRAPLSPAARDALQAAAGCTDVEFDLPAGERGRRGRGTLAALAAAVPAAQAVAVVNN